LLVSNSIIGFREILALAGADIGRFPRQSEAVLGG
jgi:hypothetical protein